MPTKPGDKSSNRFGAPRLSGRASDQSGNDNESGMDAKD